MIEQQVNSYPTKYPQGFTSKEIDDFLNKHYPEIHRDLFNERHGVNTCMLIDDEVIHYHIDIITTLRKLTGNLTVYWD